MDAQTLAVDGGCHADVHRKDLCSCRARHSADAGLTGAEVFGDDGGDILLRLGDTLGDHAVVGTKDRHAFFIQPHLRTTLR